MKDKLHFYYRNKASLSFEKHILPHFFEAPVSLAFCYGFSLSRIHFPNLHSLSSKEQMFMAVAMSEIK